LLKGSACVRKGDESARGVYYFSKFLNNVETRTRKKEGKIFFLILGVSYERKEDT